jgi:hypothetical protein
LFPFINPRLNPLSADSDKDGLPDGLELGCHLNNDGTPQLLAPAVMIDGNLEMRTNPFLPGKYTDTGRIFTWRNPLTKELVQRKTFVPDMDPQSITDPMSRDSNFDDMDDGLSDWNCNGQCDAGEMDAAAGFSSYPDAGPSIDSIHGFANMVAPILDDTVDTSSSVFKLAFQPSLNDSRFSVAISDSHLFGIDRITTNSYNRINVISIKWLPYQGPIGNREVNISVVAPYLKNGHTKTIKVLYANARRRTGGNSSAPIPMPMASPPPNFPPAPSSPTSSSVPATTFAHSLP